MDKGGEYYYVSTVYDDRAKITYYYATHHHEDGNNTVVSMGFYTFVDAEELVDELNTEMLGGGYERGD